MGKQIHDVEGTLGLVTEGAEEDDVQLNTRKQEMVTGSPII